MVRTTRMRIGRLSNDSGRGWVEASERGREIQCGHDECMYPVGFRFFRIASSVGKTIAASLPERHRCPTPPAWCAQAPAPAPTSRRTSRHRGISAISRRSTVERWGLGTGPAIHPRDGAKCRLWPWRPGRCRPGNTSEAAPYMELPATHCFYVDSRAIQGNDG